MNISSSILGFQVTHYEVSTAHICYSILIWIFLCKAWTAALLWLCLKLHTNHNCNLETYTHFMVSCMQKWFLLKEWRNVPEWCKSVFLPMDLWCKFPVWGKFNIYSNLEEKPKLYSVWSGYSDIISWCL